MTRAVVLFEMAATAAHAQETERIGDGIGSGYPEFSIECATASSGLFGELYT